VTNNESEAGAPGNQFTTTNNQYDPSPFFPFSRLSLKYVRNQKKKAAKRKNRLVLYFPGPIG
jgi:predicted nicotinamide N-methyase